MFFQIPRSAIKMSPGNVLSHGPMESSSCWPGAQLPQLHLKKDPSGWGPNKP